MREGRGEDKVANACFNNYVVATVDGGEADHNEGVPACSSGEDQLVNARSETSPLQVADQSAADSSLRLPGISRVLGTVVSDRIG